MKIKYFLFFLICSLIGITNSLRAQDSLSIKKRNIVYLVPTSVLGNLAEANAVWLMIGYDYRLNNRNIFGGTVDLIVYSKAANGGLWDKTNGFNINVQRKIIFGKEKFYINTIIRTYYSTNIFYQFTKTFRAENVNEGSPNFFINKYYVDRNMYAITPEVGFMFINKYNLYTDIGIGLGIKYVGSSSVGKINPPSIYDDKEFLTGKYFDYGHVIQPRITIQYKIGYNF